MRHCYLADCLLIIGVLFSSYVSEPKLPILNFRNSSSSWLKVVALVSSYVSAKNSCIRYCSDCSSSLSSQKVVALVSSYMAAQLKFLYKML
jgi:hypothetical protein